MRTHACGRPTRESAVASWAGWVVANEFAGAGAKALATIILARNGWPWRAFVLAKAYEQRNAHALAFFQDFAERVRDRRRLSEG